MKKTTICTLAALAFVAFERQARPLEGTHGFAVSTWDTSASTVVFAFNGGGFNGGHLFAASYNANFTSTTGNHSAQFGLHYLNFLDDKDSADNPDGTTAHGFAGSAVSLWSIPLTARFDNGLPKIALGLYLGGVPAALISGKMNYFTIPITLGAGLPLSPAKFVSFVPWFELAPSLNFDTRVKSYQPTDEEINTFLPDDTDNVNVGDLGQGDVTFDADFLKKVAEESFDFKIGAGFSVRGGLAIVFHLGDRADLQLNATVSYIGEPPSDSEDKKGVRAVFYGGGQFTFAWDEAVPAVLPPEKRLIKEECGAVEERFKSCPQYRAMLDKQKAEPSGTSVMCKEGEVLVDGKCGTPPQAKAEPVAEPAPVEPICTKDIDCPAGFVCAEGACQKPQQ